MGQRAIDEARGLERLFFYPLLCFAVLELHKFFVLREHHIAYRLHGVALINLLLFFAFREVDLFVGRERMRKVFLVDGTRPLPVAAEGGD